MKNKLKSLANTEKIAAEEESQKREGRSQEPEDK